MSIDPNGQAVERVKRVTVETTLAGYFGYGSLVNRQTLQTAYVEAHKARLFGWRRHWQARPGDGAPDGSQLALLSVHPDIGTTIDGLLVIDHAAHLPLVDFREVHYDRIALERQHLSVSRAEVKLPAAFVYVARKAEFAGQSRLLQSYLDAVMAGFYQEYGEEGLIAFLDTTDGFGMDMICDRHHPYYPRAIQLPAKLGAKFDALLAARGVRFLP